MKKFDFFKFAAIFAAVILLLAAGCSDNDNPNGLGNQGGDNGNPSENNKIFPTEPQTVSGGSLTKGGDGDNLAVTRDNFNDFIEVFRSALDKYYRPRGVRALPEEYEYEQGFMKGSYTMLDNYGGRVEIEVDYSVSMKDAQTSDTLKSYQSATLKYFDFSNHDILFLGGSVGYLNLITLNRKQAVFNDTKKAKGKINFAGKYKGTVVFDNVTLVYKYKETFNLTYKEWENGYGHWDEGRSRDTLEYEITDGRFYVESDGYEKIYLSADLFSEFIESSSGSSGISDGQITLNKLLEIPSVSDGSLTERDGLAVNAENLDDFFNTFVQEFSYGLGGGNGGYRAVRAVNEQGFYSEELKRGKVSGYWTGKLDGGGQYNNSEAVECYIVKMEYHDYSNLGSLYFGGGYARAILSSYSYLSNSDEAEEMLFNGKLKFNGKYRGDIVFDNFRYKYKKYENGDEDTTYNGSVKIGTLDVTLKYMLEVDMEIRDFW